jgi:hypothetical protein
MISLFGITLSAVSPIFLVALPILVGGLVYLFRARGKSQPKVTSSLFILKKLPTYAPSRRRFLPPMQFWLDLLLAVALVAAASGVYQTTSGKKIAIVIDNSKSMAARFSAEENRLDAAVRIAKADIVGAPTGAAFSVYSVNQKLNLVESSINAATALDALIKIKSSYQEDTLPPLIAGLVASSDYDSVWLYTDRNIEKQGDQLDSSSDKLRVTSLPYDPNTLKNSWISRLSVSSADTDSNKRNFIDVQIGRLPGTETNLNVAASCFDINTGQEISLQGVAASASTPSNRSATSLGQDFTARLGPIKAPWSYCHIILDAGDADALISDNDAWIASDAARSRSLGLHSEFSAKALGLDRLPIGEVISLSSEQQGPAQNLSGAIYHRQGDLKDIKTPSLIVYPSVGSKILGGAVGEELVGAAGGGVEITRWDETDPILRYARPGLLSLLKARILECPVGSKPFIFTASGPIACAGAENGNNYVITGFELFPFDGIRSPTLSIITLNSLQWIVGSSDQQTKDGWSKVGLIKLPESIDNRDLKVRLIAPAVRSIDVITNSTLEVPEPGVLSIASAVHPTKIIAVNSISDQESGIADLSVVQIADTNTREGVGNQKQADAAKIDGIYRFLAALALVILVIDLARRILKRSDWGRVA